jgi:hypothetical protein
MNPNNQKLKSEQVIVKLKNYYGITTYETKCNPNNEKELFRMLHTLSAHIGVDLKKIFEKGDAAKWWEDELPKDEL